MNIFNKERQTYTANIKRKSIKNISMNEEVIQELEFENVVVRHDAPFYINRFGVLISIEFDTNLASEKEAEELLFEDIKHKGQYAINSSCLYTDYKSMKSTGEKKKEEIKQLKKEFKMNKQKNRK